MPWDEQKFVMVFLTPGWWSNCAAHDQSYEAMTSDEMEIDTRKSEGPAWGICAWTKSALLQWVFSVHDERVLAIISLPGILLSGTGVRCQPYLPNFTAKEQFRVSERASSTCQAFLVSLAVCEQNVSTAYAVTLLSRVKEENRSTETIGSAWVMTVWRQISCSSSEGMLGVKWNSLGHAALLR